MKNLYNERLLKFAEHLLKIKNHRTEGLFMTVNLVALEEQIFIPYTVRYHYWMFEELPVCFDKQWFYDEMSGDPVWENINSDEGTVASVIDFFDLSLDEFAHLFDVDGFQHVDRFNGEKLSEISDGAAIAKNIVELVAGRNKNVDNSTKSA